jgi:WD40 repeat protein
MKKKLLLLSLILNYLCFPTAFSQKSYEGLQIKTETKNPFDFCCSANDNIIYITNGNKITGYSKTTGDKDPLVNFLFCDKLTSLDITSDDSLIAAGSENGSIIVWNLFSKKEIINKTIITDAVRIIRISPDKKYVAIASKKGGIDVCDLKNNTTKNINNNLSGLVTDFAFIPENDFLVASLKTGKVVGINYLTGEIFFNIDAHKAWARNVRLIPDSRKIITSGDDGFLKTWDISNTKKPRLINKLAPEKGWLTACEAVPDKSVVICGSLSGKIFVSTEFGFDVIKLQGIPIKLRVTGCEDGKNRLIVLTNNGRISVYNLP